MVAISHTETEKRLFHYCLWSFSGKPGEVADGVQFVQGWGTSASDGEVYDPAEPEQRARVKCIKRGDCITEKGLKHDHAIKPMLILAVYILYQLKKELVSTIPNNRKCLNYEMTRRQNMLSIFIVKKKN